MKLPAIQTAALPVDQAREQLSALKQASVELEATFLTEMLRSGGLGKAPQAFGGGAGEQQFSSMLVQQQAKELARAGGIGLARILFESLAEKVDV